MKKPVIARVDATSRKRTPRMRMRIRRPRCAWVLAILDNRIETVELLREEIHPPTGDFADRALEIAVVRRRELEVSIPLNSVVFLHGRYDQRA